ncbi:MAG: T9SS type A sorting domain-containing protein [Bacteroidales bacterium]
MKKIYILLIFSLLLTNIFGQISLTSRDNGLLPGDSSRTREINFVDPGNPGENLVWNFSGIVFTGKSTFCGVKENSELKATAPGGKNLTVSEDGYDYNYMVSETGYQETGYVNNAKKMTLEYPDPIVKMKYPFSYGAHFSDPFTGIAWYNGTSRIDLSGEYTVSADATGTLILPDRMVTNTLRVKIVKNYLQIGTCGSTQTRLEKYYWYAPGYRYPVMMVSTNTNTYSGKEPVVVQSAWVNVSQLSSGALTAGTDPKNQAEAGVNSAIAYPNPFSDQFTYNYLLQKQAPVTIELYDMSGQFNVRIEKRQIQSEGLHTGTVNSAVLGLAPGMYYLRFTLDKQVIVTKIVKI